MFRAALTAVAVAVALLAPIATAAQEATPARDCPASGPEENRAMVQAWYDAIDAGDVTAFDDIFAPTVVQHAADFADARGVEEIQSSFDAFIAAFPDLRHDIDQWVTDGDFVAVRVIGQGTHQGEFMGIAPTGRDVA